MKKSIRIAALLSAMTLALAMTGCSNGSNTTFPPATKLAGSISYATTSVKKLDTDAAFTNKLTKTGDGVVVYSSSDTSVATIDVTTGEVTLKAVGTTTIRATVSDSAAYTYAQRSASYDLYVTNADNSTPLTLEFTTDGTITFSNKPAGLQYSKDGGATKNAVEGDSLPVPANEAISLFSNGTGSGNSAYFNIHVDHSCYIYGNVMSLESADDFAYCLTIKNDYEFKKLFYNNTSLSSHATKKLVLPATTLKKECYSDMFCNSGITKAPEILPAKKLEFGCYASMFLQCIFLTSAPKLPATVLTQNCYVSMFKACMSLETAPDLPAETLAPDCYRSMFNNCPNLKNVKCLAVDISADSCVNDWLYGVASSGTFVKAAGMTLWPTNSTSGIPNGWTVSDAN